MEGSMGVSRAHPLEMKQLRHMVQRFERETFALIGEYLIVYRYLLYRIAALVGMVEQNDQMTARNVEERVEQRPTDLLRSLRRCCEGKRINQRGKTLDARALSETLTHLVDLRHMIAHTEFEHGPSWAADIDGVSRGGKASRPNMEARGSRTTRFNWPFRP